MTITHIHISIYIFLILKIFIYTTVKTWYPISIIHTITIILFLIGINIFIFWSNFIFLSFEYISFYIFWHLSAIIFVYRLCGNSSLSYILIFIFYLFFKCLSYSYIYFVLNLDFFSFENLLLVFWRNSSASWTVWSIWSLASRLNKIR